MGVVARKYLWSQLPPRPREGTAWAQDLKVTVSYDGITALQPEQQDETLSLKKKVIGQNMIISTKWMLGKNRNT